jgi:anaerobic carbon-monoxide dehydrogenase iron sulfur subunit
MTSQKKIEFEFTKTTLRKRRTLDANSKTCSGCRICELICSLTHGKEINPGKSRISIRSNPFKGSHVPQICRHCSDVPCMQACEVSAIQILEKDGTVFIKDEVCTGCRSCEKECPFGAIKFDSARRKAFKCDLCNGDPQCVRWCPTHSLGVTEFGG